jgi:hypothetical protein
MNALFEVLTQLRIDDLHREAAQARLALSAREAQRRVRTGRRIGFALPRLWRRLA